MTILEPRVNHRSWSLPIILLILGLCTLAITGIYFYNQNVVLRHAIKDNLKNIQTLQVANADYKNRLYRAFDSANVESLAASHNLIAEKAPRYIEQGAGLIVRNN